MQEDVWKWCTQDILLAMVNMFFFFLFHYITNCVLLRMSARIYQSLAAVRAGGRPCMQIPLCGPSTMAFVCNK